MSLCGSRCSARRLRRFGWKVVWVFMRWVSFSIIRGIYAVGWVAGWRWLIIRCPRCCWLRFRSMGLSISLWMTVIRSSFRLIFLSLICCSAISVLSIVLSLRTMAFTISSNFKKPAYFFEIFVTTSRTVCIDCALSIISPLGLKSLTSNLW